MSGRTPCLNLDEDCQSGQEESISVEGVDPAARVVNRTNCGLRRRFAIDWRSGNGS